jgi:dynamin 1-like protein
VLQVHLPELSRYYKLQSRMQDVMESVLDSCLTPTNDMILDLIEIETSLINTNHPDFIGSADSLLNLFSEQEPPSEDAPKTFSLLKEAKEPEPVQKPAAQKPEPVVDTKPEPRPSRSWIPSFFGKSQ